MRLVEVWSGVVREDLEVGESRFEGVRSRGWSLCGLE